MARAKILTSMNMSRSTTSLIAAVLCFSVFVGKGQSYLINDVTVISMSSEDPLTEINDVLIKDGTITKIGRDLKAPSGIRVIKGTGKYLIPGLAEMHAHIPSKQQGDDYIHEVLFLYLSQGVTTIRGMLGEPYHLLLRENVLSGKVEGPRIYTSGPSLNGNTVKSVSEARSKVLQQKEAGYDFMKLHPGIRLEVYDEIVKMAKEIGLPYAGHVSVFVGIRHALETGYASIDHIDGYLEGLVPLELGFDPSVNGFFGFNFIDKVDESLIPELIRLTQENSVWVVPTQSLLERWVGPAQPGKLGEEPAMKYVSNRTLGGWVSSKRRFTADENYSEEKAQRFNELRRKLILAMHEGGVGLLLGSDAPQVFNVPGFSIHNELNELVRSGLTPYEALTTGTRNPANFFNALSSFGTISEGKSADLVLLSHNPLKDIGNTRKIEGVMVRGLWYSKSDLSNRLKEIEEKYEN